MGWGGIWGSAWSGGTAAPGTSAAAATTATSSRALAIIETLEAAITRTASGLTAASYRMPLELQAIGGTHRAFQVRLTGVRLERQAWGAGLAFLALDVAVRVSYARPGGEGGGGDRKSINIQVGTDGVLIQDAMEDPRNWDRDVSGIRNVALRVGSFRVVDDRQREVWQHSFTAVTRLPWPA